MNSGLTFGELCFLDTEIHLPEVSVNYCPPISEWHCRACYPGGQGSQKNTFSKNNRSNWWLSSKTFTPFLTTYPPWSFPQSSQQISEPGLWEAVSIHELDRWTPEKGLPFALWEHLCSGPSFLFGSNSSHVTPSSAHTGTCDLLCSEDFDLSLMDLGLNSDSKTPHRVFVIRKQVCDVPRTLAGTWKLLLSFLCLPSKSWQEARLAA